MEIYPDKLIIQEKYTTLLRILIWNNIHEPNLACNVMSLVGYTIYNCIFQAESIIRTHLINPPECPS